MELALTLFGVAITALIAATMVSRLESRITALEKDVRAIRDSVAAPAAEEPPRQRTLARSG